MAVWNNGRYVAEAIESILAQTFGDFEFLIVDDGSTDDSGAIIDDYAARDPRIRAVHQANQGFVASLNHMLAQARAPLVARMDGDDRCTPDRLERQYAFLAGHPDHGVIGTQTIYFDDSGREWPMRRTYPLDHVAFLAALERPGTPLMNHASVLMRTDILRQVGGYRPQFRHCEDLDLWLRLSEVTRLASLREAPNHYRIHAGQTSRRHVAVQTAWAMMAWLSHRARIEGRADPFEGLATLPALDDLDRLAAITGDAGDPQRVRAAVIDRIIDEPHELAGPSFAVLTDYLAAGGPIEKGWRLVARLLRCGLPRRAIRIARALLTR